MDILKNTDYHIENYLIYKIHKPQLAKDVMFLVCSTPLLNSSYTKFPEIIPVIFTDFLNELPYLMNEVLVNIDQKPLKETKIKDYKFYIQAIEKMQNFKFPTKKENNAVKNLENEISEFISICKKEIVKIENKSNADINDNTISLKEIALLYYYQNIQITRGNEREILKKYNFIASNKLYQHYTYYTSKSNRLGCENTFRKQKNKIELFENVLQLLLKENLDSKKIELDLVQLIENTKKEFSNENL